MTNGLSHFEAWRRLLDDGQDHRVLELVVNELDSIEVRGRERYDTAMANQKEALERLGRRMTYVTSTLVTILLALIAIAIRL